MIIQSIRLKNIKSYGEGPDGNGITVAFNLGVNRIAGKNGGGKTTLIESLGYALFVTRPQFEENFNVDTYFLRTGQKAGEIDVTFSHLGESYRIERGLGLQSKRRSKVIQLSDGSTCAENDDEVCAWLCRLLGFPDESRLSELFSKLIGVKQGRLTWPFDSKAAEAKRFFEPLLDVAVFRECFDQLKPVVDQFQELQHEQETKLSGVAERIRERDGAAGQVEAKRQAVTNLEKHIQLLTQTLEECRKSKESLETRETTIRTAEKQVGLNKSALELAQQRREAAENRVQESTKAAETLLQTQPGYRAWEQAEALLKDLRARQSEQRRLEKDKSEATRQITELNGQTRGAREQAETFASQKAEKQKELTPLREKLDCLRLRLENTRTEFEQRKAAAAQASKDLSVLAHFVESLPGCLMEQRLKLEKIVTLTRETAAWDPSALATAQKQEAAAEHALQEARSELTQARERHRALSEQLKEISGGACPFLKQECKQFKPAEIGADVGKLHGRITELEKSVIPAETAFRLAKAERNRLHSIEAGLSVKRTHLQELTRELVGEMTELIPKTTLATASRLGSWTPTFPALPQMPSLPAANADCPALADAYQQIVVTVNQAEVWWNETNKIAQSRLEAFSSEERARLAEQKDAVYLRSESDRLDREIKELGAQEQKRRDTVVLAEKKTAEIAVCLAGLDRQLASFLLLPEEINKQEEIQRSHRAEYQSYLGAKPLADQLSARHQELEKQRIGETTAVAALKTSVSVFEEARKDFEPESLALARAQFAQAGADLARENANLNNTKTDMLRDEGRLEEWQKACTLRDKIQAELARLQAAIDLTELARKVLRDSAPEVAQHLCSRIAARAQQIFNHINHDPVALSWDAAHYSLRIEPGARRFAMLSGGEQTKLALAMTLAMIQEFSGLKFCIFDEPTYGVDADSRSKLADTILEAQKAAGLNQLLLVSHDDAFEGKIEHVVCIRKVAGEGSAPVL